MTKKRFTNNNSVGCEPKQAGVPLKERIAQTKNNIRRHKSKLKQTKKYMDTLKDMSSDYDFHQDSLNVLVGNTYILIDRTKGWIETEKAILTKLKEETK